MTRKGHNLDVIAAIEACYASGDEKEWLGGICDALAPLDDGLGISAFTFGVSDREKLRVGPHVDRGAVAPVSDAIFSSVWAQASPEFIDAFFIQPAPVTLAARTMRVFRGDPGPFRQTTKWSRGRNGIVIFGRDVGGRDAVVTVHLRSADYELPPRTAHVLRCLSAHISTALRLRRLGERPSPESSRTDAVLDPRGNLQSGSAGAADTLSQAVRAVERARGQARRVDAVEAAALWQGLVDGTWSLVDHVESDGRRLVLAVHNPPGVRDPKALTPRERDVLAYAAMGRSNKYIGYLLGIGATSVAGHLTAAGRKLALPSRRALIEAFGPAVRSSPATR